MSPSSIERKVLETIATFGAAPAAAVADILYAGTLSTTYLEQKILRVTWRQHLQQVPVGHRGCPPLVIPHVRALHAVVALCDDSGQCKLCRQHDVHANCIFR